MHAPLKRKPKGSSDCIIESCQVQPAVCISAPILSQILWQLLPASQPVPRSVSDEQYKPICLVIRVHGEHFATIFRGVQLRRRVFQQSLQRLLIARNDAETDIPKRSPVHHYSGHCSQTTAGQLAGTQPG